MFQWLANSKEPTLILAAVNAGIGLAVSFGLNVTPQQVGAINAFVTAILAAILRQAVTPTGKS